MSAIEHLLLSSLQPQGRFRLLRDSPLFEALSLVALPNHGPRNLVSGYLGAYYGAPLLNAGPGGLELDSSMGGRNRLRLSPEFTSSSTPQAAIYDVSVLSALVITYQTSNQNSDFTLGRMNGSGSPGWAVGLHSGSSNGPAARLGSFSLGGFSGGYRRSEPTVVLLTGDGSTARVYENGAEVSSGSYTAPYYDYSAFDGRSVLMGGAGDGGASQCRTSLGLFWSGRVIPPAVAALLTSPAEVWRLLVEPRRIWVPVAAGGGAAADLATTGNSGTFSGTANSPATATLAATGASGALSASAGTSASAALAATGDSGTLSASAYTPALASLAATGGSGIFVGSAFSEATAALSATGGSGTLSASAGAEASASLAATGGSGTLAADAFVHAVATLAATGVSGSLIASAWTTISATLSATGGSGELTASAGEPVVATRVLSSYRPLPPPADPKDVGQWAMNELLTIARHLADGRDFDLLNTIHAQPSKPREGMVVHADGTNWDPGSGAGRYERVGGAWVKL